MAQAKDRDNEGGANASGGGKSGGGASSGGRSGGVRPPRDAFVSKLVADPANLEPQAPVVLRGFVGDSDEEGYTRIYCGPALDAYSDVRDEDILHYEAATDGGEHTLWARADAQVKHGRRGQPKSEAAGFLQGPLLQDYAGGAGGAQPGGQMQITLLTYAGCFTHQPWCTSFCPTGPVVCPETLICPPPTLDCPDPIGGVGFRAAAAPAAGPVGPTGWQGCGVTRQLGCPRTSTCPPTSMPGCPSTSTCPPTHMLGCPRTSTCPPTNMLGCPRTSTCPPTLTPGCQDPTAATMCFICPPLTADCPRTADCPVTQAPGCQDPTAATMCFICPPITADCPRTSTCPVTQTPGCQDPTAATMCFVCPPITADCPVEQGGGGAEAFRAAAPAAGAAAQTSFPLCQVVRTWYNCPTLPHCLPPWTAATVCTRYHCPGPATYQAGCTLGFTCTYVGCPPRG